MKESIRKILNLIYLRIVIYIPIVTILIVGVFYIFLLIKNPFSIERERVLFGIDIMSATLAGLIFYASSAAKDADKKKIYYVNAEKFLHATILMGMATILEGTVVLIGPYRKSVIFDGAIIFILIFTTIIYFLFGLRDLMSGLVGMMKNMYLEAGKY